MKALIIIVLVALATRLLFQYIRYRLCTYQAPEIMLDATAKESPQEQNYREALQRLIVYRTLRDSVTEGMTLEQMINAFEDMCSIPVGDPDDCLFETGTYRINGKKQFQFSLVRQFQFMSGDEYVQLHLTISYPPRKALWWLYNTVWSMDIRGNFFENVKKSLAFRLFKNVPFSNVEVYINET